MINDKWKMENLAVPIFHFPFSISHFPFSIFHCASLAPPVTLRSQ